MPKQDDLERRAQEYDDDGEQPWKPAPGEVLFGTVVRIEIRPTQYDPAVPVLTVRTTAQDWAVWAFYTVLRNELRKANVQPGDKIAIKRLTDSARGYRRYKVFKEGAETVGFDWQGVPVDAGDVDPSQMESLLRNPDQPDPAQAETDPPPNTNQEAKRDPEDDLPF